MKISFFEKQKPVIAMLHLGFLLGSPKFEGLDKVIDHAVSDIQALQENGIDGILIENWKENSVEEFVEPETAVCLATVLSELKKHITVPFGINILNNDYKVALSLAKLFSASFVELDVFTDHVRSNFSYSEDAKQEPFEINPHPKDILEYAKKINASDIPLFVFIQPKHYTMLDKEKTIDQSAKEAVQAGASAVLITKATGSAPTTDLILKAKTAIPDIPVGIGSGFSAQNASEFLPVVDFAVVGTSLKVDTITDNPVDPKKVQELMEIVEKLRS